MIELLTPVFLNLPIYWIQELRNWENEQNRISVESMLNSSLAEFNHGSNGSSKQEELLQFSCNEDQESLRRGYNRCNNRSWFRPSKD